MAVRSRRVWRAAPGTLVVVALFALACGVGVPGLAYVLYSTRQQLLLPILLLLLAVAGLVYAWRFGLHPRVIADERRLTVVNPRRRTSFAWEDVTVIAPGPDGLLIGSERAVAEAWCVQKSNWSTRKGRRTRADEIVDTLADLRDRHDPPLLDEVTGLRIRRARISDLDLLTRLERTASEAALGHIFPAARYPYPTDDVRRRWHRLLRDPVVQVRVLELFDVPIGYLAYETEGVLRHLGVVPHQSRRGFGSVLLAYAVEEIFGSGAPKAELWVLTENTVARAFYAARGWTTTADTGQAEFPPYPDEVRMERANPSAPRRGR